MMERGNRRVPPDKRKRVETSCDRCKARKQKCDKAPGEDQCRYCELHKIACTSTLPRKRNDTGLEHVRSRVTLLESLVKGILPEANLAGLDDLHRLGVSLGIPLPDLEEDSSDGPLRPAEDSAAEVIPDQQNQPQYVGPASSFLFHLRLRRMIGIPKTSTKFEMFGDNAADEVIEAVNSQQASRPSPDQRLSESDDCASPSDTIRRIDSVVLETLMDAYFDIVHPDFPVLHEPSFRDTYETWLVTKTNADPVWLCSALCVLILARRVAAVDIPVEAEKRWWKHVQTLLPTVTFSSQLSTIQALLLVALHLHNTSHRDACWNLTGTAVRVAHAIGMHRSNIKHTDGRYHQELRKRIWWTLYTFEHMQVSSYDRPSSILHSSVDVEAANERVLAGMFAPEYAQWSRRLSIILGSASNALTACKMPSSEAYSKPLSPVATILRDLARWKADLPNHLRWEVLDSLAPSQQRPLILLHAQYDYIVILMTRSALLRQATMVMQNPCQAIPDALVKVSETCVDAGHSLGDALRRLQSLKKFNSATWFDLFYMVAAALVLVLNIRVKPQESTESTCKLLNDLAQIAAIHLSTKHIPGTMRALALIVVDVSASDTRAKSSESTKESPRPKSVPADSAQGSIHDHIDWQSIDEMGFLQTISNESFDWDKFELMDDMNTLQHATDEIEQCGQDPFQHT